MSNFGDDLIQSLNEALAHAKGEGPATVHAPVDPREVRRQANLTQLRMAALMGMSLSGYRGGSREGAASAARPWRTCASSSASPTPSGVRCCRRREARGLAGYEIVFHFTPRPRSLPASRTTDIDVFPSPGTPRPPSYQRRR